MPLLEVAIFPLFRAPKIASFFTSLKNGLAVQHIIRLGQPFQSFKMSMIRTIVMFAIGSRSSAGMSSSSRIGPMIGAVRNWQELRESIQDESVH